VKVRHTAARRDWSVSFLETSSAAVLSGGWPSCGSATPFDSQYRISSVAQAITGANGGCVALEQVHTSGGSTAPHSMTATCNASGFISATLFSGHGCSGAVVWQRAAGVASACAQEGDTQHHSRIGCLGDPPLSDAVGPLDDIELTVTNNVGQSLFLSSSLAVSTPIINAYTSIAYSFSLNVPLEISDNITLTLPRFGLVRGINRAVPTTTGCGATGFVIETYHSYEEYAQVVFTATGAALQAEIPCTLTWTVGPISPPGVQPADLSTRTASAQLAARSDIAATAIPTSPAITTNRLTYSDGITNYDTSISYMFTLEWPLGIGDTISLVLPNFRWGLNFAWEYAPTLFDGVTTTSGCGGATFTAVAAESDLPTANIVLTVGTAPVVAHSLCTVSIANGIKTPDAPQPTHLTTRTVRFVSTYGGLVPTRPIAWSQGITARTLSGVAVLTPSSGAVNTGTRVIATARDAVRICYTTDGTTPVCSASMACAVGVDQDHTPIPALEGPTTVKAIGCADFLYQIHTQRPEPNPTATHHWVGHPLTQPPVVTASYTMTAITAGLPVLNPLPDDLESVTRRCHWSIEAPMGSVVQLSIGSLLTARTPDCVAEHLRLVDGLREGAYEMGRYCGITPPGVLVSTTRAMQLIFQAPSASHSSFSARFTTMRLSAELSVSTTPYRLGEDIAVHWTVNYVPRLAGEISEAMAWVGLYKAGECTADNLCYLAHRTVPINSMSGGTQFTMVDYGHAGTYELRFFRGEQQGYKCTGQSNLQYHSCILEPVATSATVIVTANRESGRAVPTGFEHANPSFYLN